MTTSRKYKATEEEAQVKRYKPRITSVIDWTLKIIPKHMEFPTGESMTIPDQSYEIKDLVKKMAAGVDPAISKVASYGGDDDEIDFDDIDLNQAQHADFTEVDEIKREHAQRQFALLRQLEDEMKPQKIDLKKEDEKSDDLRHEKGANSDAQKQVKKEVKNGSENDPKT